MVINYLDLEAKFMETDNKWALQKLEEWEDYEFIKSQQAKEQSYDWLFKKSRV
jgi:hypothetical protein